MWTSSCFTWKYQFMDPYPYFTVLGAVLKVMLVFGAKKYYGITADPSVCLRDQTSLQEKQKQTAGNGHRKAQQVELYYHHPDNISSYVGRCNI